MLFLQLWWTLLVVGSSSTLPMHSQQGEGDGGGGDSDKLQDFNRAVEAARNELHEIKSRYGGSDDLLQRNKRSTIDDMLANFAPTAEDEPGAVSEEDRDLQSAADAWFRDFQAGAMAAHECADLSKRDTKQTRDYLSDHSKAMKQTEIGKVKEKYKNTPIDTMVWNRPVEDAKTTYDGMTELDLKLKHVQGMLNEQEKVSSINQRGKDRWRNELVTIAPRAGFDDNSVVPEGAYEQTLAKLNYPHISDNKLFVSQRNNLSHEANYKLSKIEQEASERAMKTGKAGVDGEDGSLEKRNAVGFNPMNEIKLKTSHRLMRKGLGPSLPSNGLMDTRRAHYVDDVIRRMERNMEQRQQRNDQNYRNEDSSQMESTMPRYDTLRELPPFEALPVNSMDEITAMNSALEAPQSYQYMLPSHYDQFNQYNNQPMPRMRDYARKKRIAVDTVLQKLGKTISAPLMAVKLPELVEHKVEQIASVDNGNADAKADVAGKMEGDVGNAEGEGQAQSLFKQVDEVKLDTEGESKLTSNKLDSEFKVDSLLKPEVISKTETTEAKTSCDSHSEVAAGSDAKPEAEHDEPLNDAEAKLSAAAAKTVGHANEDKMDAGLGLNIKLKLEDASPAVADPKLESEPARPMNSGNAAVSVPVMPHKVNSDAVVKILANQISLQKEKQRGKRHIWHWRPRKHKRMRRSLDAHAPDGSLKDAHAMAKRHSGSLDDFEDHNGNRPRFGSLGNGLLTLDSDENMAREVEEVPYPRHQLAGYDYDSEGDEEHDTDSIAHTLDTNRFDNTHLQVPMLSNRNSNPQQQQLSVNFSQQQKQPIKPQQQQQPQQPAVQSQFKASFNLTNFLNELAKLQKMHQPQQALQPQQQTHQNAQPQPQQQQIQHAVQQQQQQPRGQMNIHKKPSPVNPNKGNNQNRQNFGYHRYFGPLFNRANQQANSISKPNMQAVPDPCLTSTPPPPDVPTLPPGGDATPPTMIPETTTSASMVVTLNPDCIPIANVSSTTEIPMTTIMEPDTITSSNSAPAGTETTTPVPTTMPVPPGPASNETMSSFCNGPDMVKLNVSINANVCGDIKTKQFYGNGSISMQPGYEGGRSGEVDEDYTYESEDGENVAEWQDHDHTLQRRSSDTQEEEETEDKDNEDKDKSSAKNKEKIKDKNKDKNKQKSKDKNKNKSKEKNKGTDKDTDQPKSDKKHKKTKGQGGSLESTDRSGGNKNEPCPNSFEKLLIGKTSEAIVNAVFKHVSNDPTMDRVYSVLEKNRRCIRKHPKTLYQIRNGNNEQRVQQTEDMIKESMEAISDIIDRQMRNRACIPLRPDLSEFYDLIVRTMAEQDKCREKRQITLRGLADDFSQDVRSLDPNKIEQKSRIVKKLLRQYDELTQEDQRAMAGVRDELLMDLIYLRKVADTVERSRRNDELEEMVKKSRTNRAVEGQLAPELSNRFVKLLKTAELFKEAAMQQQKAQNPN